MAEWDGVPGSGGKAVQYVVESGWGFGERTGGVGGSLEDCCNF